MLLTKTVKIKIVNNVISVVILILYLIQSI